MPEPFFPNTSWSQRVPDQWAIVTGASSGIGAAIAEELAARRWSVVLVGRDEEALARQAAKLAPHGVRTLTIAADLSTSEGLARVRARLAEEKLPVAALVNNAGFGLHAPFESTASADEARMIDLQLKAMLELTKTCLPGMRERKHGYVLNVASVYAYSPVPQQAVYAACKAFMLSFSRTLALELDGSGVSVTVLCPGITQTNFRARAGMKEKRSAFGLSAAEVARIAVRGMLSGKLVVVPGWGNTLYVCCARWLPAGLLGRFTRWFNRRRGLTPHAGEKA